MNSLSLSWVFSLIDFWSALVSDSAHRISNYDLTGYDYDSMSWKSELSMDTDVYFDHV